MARPTKFTKKTRKLFCDARSIGLPYRACAQYAGITYEAFNKWMNRARLEIKRMENDEDADPLVDEKPFVQFFHEVTEAEAGAAVTWQQVIADAAAINPQWAAWMLTRAYPEYYNPVQKQELDTHQTVEVTVSDWRKQAEAARKQAGDTLADFDDEIK